MLKSRKIVFIMTDTQRWVSVMIKMILRLFSIALFPPV